ncbi:helix-turn-helix transcriptional regulator [Salmonella enterica]|nr:helix-turn-helix transcriptional regulator [Salmonella enterica]EBJ0585876.1 helix-turn-helix transcriptional regulator [Salmonella enterica]HAF2460913.1 helix-turn-helix transcriptional regulator [Salmonella enterica]
MSELIVHASGIMIEPMVQEEKARKEFSQRLALACDKAGLQTHGRQAEIAKKMKLTPKAVSKWFNGESIPRRGALQELAAFIGTSSSFLLGDTMSDGVEDGHLSPTHEGFKIDVLDITVSAGPGVTNSDFVEVLRSVEYSTEEARQMFNGRKPEQIRIINVRGDSMSGTIEPGDLLFVDIGIQHFDGDGIYAFVYDDTAHVKRLQKMKDRLIVLSDNKIYPAWEPIERDEMNRVLIFGKVIGSMPQTYRKHG